MATFSTPLPAPVKNDWLPTGENPRLSPPSPGGPRKNAPVQQVSLLPWKLPTFAYFFFNSFLSRDQWEARQDEALLLLQLVADLRQLFPIDQEVKSKTIKHKHHKLTRLHQQVQPHQFQAVAQLVRHCQHHSFHRKYSNVLIVVSIAEPRTNL